MWHVVDSSGKLKSCVQSLRLKFLELKDNLMESIDISEINDLVSSEYYEDRITVMF